MEALHRLALRLFGVLPVRARRRIVRTISPSYTVGSMCFVERHDGALLLVRLAYRDRWGVPGGLLKKGEDTRAAAEREAREEIGVEVDVVGEPAVVVDPGPQRVDIIYRCRVRDGFDPEDVSPSSPEILEVRWFAPDELPELQFETAGALLALARNDVAPHARRLPEPTFPDLGEAG